MNAFAYLNQFSDDSVLIHRKVDTAVKFVGNPDAGRIGGYLVVWGSPAQRDLQGEYFTPETELGLDWYTHRPVLYHHTLDNTLKAALIGTIDTLKADEVGLWAEAQLDLRQRYVRAVHNLVDKGVLAWSSGSLPHVVEISSDGHIKRWPIIEGSLTPTPAEPRHTDVRSIKSAIQSALDLSASPEAEEHDAEEPTGTGEGDGATQPTTATKVKTMNMLDMIMQVLNYILQAKPDWQLTDEERSALVQQVATQLQPETAGGMPTEETAMASLSGKAAGFVLTALTNHFTAKARQAETINNATKAALLNNAPPQSRAPLFTLEGNPGSNGNGGQPTPAPRIEMRTKYADLSAEDMSYFILLKNSIRRKNNRPGWQPDSPFMRELADKAGKAYEQGKIKFGDEAETAQAIKSINAFKANELGTSTQADYGDEWVPDLWSSQIWERARLDNVVLPLFQVVEMPSNPFEIPVESTDPTVYYVTETADEASLTLAASGNPIPDSKMKTGKVQLNAKKLALRVGFSTELEEDSIIPWTATLREQAQRALLDAIDNVLLNGDTATGANTNINLIDGTPGANDKYLAFNGLRKLPFVTNTGNRTDGLGAAVTLAQLRQARFLLDRAYSANPKNLVILTHAELYAKMLGLSEFITMDKAGDKATNLTGQIGIVDGAPVLVSAEFPLTDTAGKVPAAGGTLGSALVVYRPGWYVGYRRKVTVSVDYLPYYDSYQLTGTVRLAFVNRDNDVAAGLYNSLV